MFLRFRFYALAHASHVLLYDVCTVHPLAVSQCLALHHSLFPSTLPLLPLVALQLVCTLCPFCAPLQGRLWALDCKETGIAGGLQNAVAARSVCVCVHLWGMRTCLNVFQWSCAALCTSEASALEDVCRLRMDELQMLFTGMARKAA